MSIKCSYASIDRLRDQGIGRPGLYSRFLNHVTANALDRHRIRKFCRVVMPIIEEYEVELAKLGKEHGTPSGKNTFSVSGDKLPAFLEAKKALDAVEIEVTTVLLPASTWSQVPMSASEEEFMESSFGEPQPQPEEEEEKKS